MLPERAQSKMALRPSSAGNLRGGEEIDWTDFIAPQNWQTTTCTWLYLCSSYKLWFWIFYYSFWLHSSGVICATALAAGVPRLQENYEVRVLWAIHRTDLGHNVRHHLFNIPQSYHAPLQLHQTSPSSIVARRNLAKLRIIPSTLPLQDYCAAEPLCLAVICLSRFKMEFWDDSNTEARELCSSKEGAKTTWFHRMGPSCSPLKGLPDLNSEANTFIHHASIIPYIHTHTTHNATYVCMYVRMYVCMYVCNYVKLCMYVWMYVCMYVWMYECMNVWMYVCMHVCMYVCMLCYVMYVVYVL